MADGGLVAHFTGPDDGNGPLGHVSQAQREAWIAAMSPIEPIQCCPANPVPILSRMHATISSCRGALPRTN
jgi:hypothetical protein